MLAGVGCKDYDDDIKEINNKIEGLETGKLASLEEQLNSLKVTISTLEQADKDLQQKINEQESSLKKNSKKQLKPMKACKPILII